jgi:hypothetical protein
MKWNIHPADINDDCYTPKDNSFYQKLMWSRRNVSHPGGRRESHSLGQFDLRSVEGRGKSAISDSICAKKKKLKFKTN